MMIFLAVQLHLSCWLCHRHVSKFLAAHWRRKQSNVPFWSKAFASNLWQLLVCKCYIFPLRLVSVIKALPLFCVEMFTKAVILVPAFNVQLRFRLFVFFKYSRVWTTCGGCTFATALCYLWIDFVLKGLCLFSVEMSKMAALHASCYIGSINFIELHQDTFIHNALGIFCDRI